MLVTHMSISVTPPEGRIDDYYGAVMTKLERYLKVASEQNLMPVFIGRTFKLPEKVQYVTPLVSLFMETPALFYTPSKQCSDSAREIMQLITTVTASEVIGEDGYELSCGDVISAADKSVIIKRAHDTFQVELNGTMQSEEWDAGKGLLKPLPSVRISKKMESIEPGVWILSKPEPEKWLYDGKIESDSFDLADAERVTLKGKGRSSQFVSGLMGKKMRAKESGEIRTIEQIVSDLSVTDRVKAHVFELDRQVSDRVL